MKKAGLIGIILLLAGVITFYLLLHKPSVHENLVKFKGQVAVTNFSKGYLDWASGSGFTDTISALPAQKNDLIAFFPPDEDEDYFLMIQNKKPEDKVLNVRMDSLGLYLDGKLVSLVLNENENAFLKWINNSKKEDILHLQSVILSDSLSDTVLKGIEKIGQTSKGIGLFLNQNSDRGFEALKYLNPTWLWLNTELDSLMSDQLYKNKNLESLILSEGSNHQINLSRLSRLKSLQFIEPDSADLIQLGQLPKNVTSLQVISSNLKDLSFIQNNLHLEELKINHCNSLKDISSLNKLPHLKVLSLVGCDTIADLGPLSGLKELTWLGLPASITEIELASIVNNSPDIETLILLNSRHLKSLDKLKNLNKLSYLAILDTDIVPDSLFRFQQLKYLAYGHNSNDSIQSARDSVNVIALKKAMPHTLVTAAEPFCLSTGWLIVFFALLILFTFIAVKIKNKVSAS